MKFCKDCKHIRISTTGLVPEVCLSPNLPIDLVTGSPKFMLCKDQRYPYFSSSIPVPRGINLCGVEGNWFEQKVFEPTSVEDADLDDLSKIPFGR